MKRQVPIIITFVVGAVLIISVFFPPAERLGENFSVFFDIIAVFAFFLGGGNLIRIHGNKIYRRGKDWPFSIVTLTGFLVMLAAGLFKIANPNGITGDVAATGSLFQTLYFNIFYPLGSTMYALLAFYVASASYRAFRAKNKEATILLIAAFIILLGRTPLGVYATGWIPESFSLLQIPNLAIWIMSSPNLAGQRAIMIGIALGVISMSLRLILGVERTYLGADNE
ncbi:conserved membrane hypothetical protein [Candidatus Zixiibacteriota bacterium]|nr:conserved membrane hypothetical protein [candidate division Zixibacteria bacterium]